MSEHHVTFTNLDKVLYPETGTTKAEVITYYRQIAPVLLPHLRHRPITRKRWPDGVGGQVFFQKDAGRGVPDWIRTAAIPGATSDAHYVLVEDVAGLEWLGQQAALELHVPQWRFAEGPSRMPPDRLVLDFDPGEGVGLPECAQVASWAREIVAGMGLDPVPVTSGSKGIHVYAALPASQGPPRTSDAVSAVAKELAQHLAADHPELVVSDMAKAKRVGKVLVDWSQNNGAKTTLSPYSLRGVAQPFVAAPRTWDELAKPNLRNLRFDEVLARVSADGDLLAAAGIG